MAKHIINPTITVNGTDISDHVIQFSISVEAAEVETTAFGTSWRSRISGLKTGSVQIDYQNDYAAAQASAVINPLLGSIATVVVSQTGTGGTIAGTALCLVVSTQPINGSVGDLSTSSVTWPTSGTTTGFGL